MHLAISVLPYKLELILSWNESVVPRILDGITHVVLVTLIVAEYVNLFNFTVLKWKEVFPCENETCWIYLVKCGLPR